MLEQWDLYTKSRQLTGKTHLRGERIPEGYYHLVVHVWIRNQKGEYLISQRSADRQEFPLKWECVGGSVLAGEDSLTGALREVREEIGLQLPGKDGRLVFSRVGRVFRGVQFNDILDVWLFPYDGSVFLERATTREVAQIKWMSRKEISLLFEAGELVETLEYFFREIALDDAFVTV